MKLLLLLVAVAYGKSPFSFTKNFNLIVVDTPMSLPEVGAAAHIKPPNTFETGLKVYANGEADFSKKVYISDDDRVDFARQLAQQAKTVEFCTINPYLTARYSIIPGIDDNSDALKLTLRQIPIQEMLHSALSTNLAVALGGTALFYTGQENQCQYNFPLIDFFDDCEVRDLELTVGDAAQWHNFFRVESEHCKILLDADIGTFVYQSISGLYHDLERLMVELESEANRLGKSIFLSNDPDDQTGRQMHPDTAYFFQEITVQLVTDIETALNLTNVITLQGEGGGIPQDNIMGPAHAELFFMGQVMAEGNGVHLWEFGDQRLALTNDLNKALFESFNAAFSLLMLTLEKIYMVNENTPEGMELKAMLMSNEINAPSNIQAIMGPTIGVLGELMGTRGVHPGFRYYEFAPGPSPDECPGTGSPHTSFVCIRRGHQDAERKEVLSILVDWHIIRGDGTPGDGRHNCECGLNPTPKQQLLKELEIAKNFAVADGSKPAYDIIQMVITNVMDNFLVDFPLVGI